MSFIHAIPAAVRVMIAFGFVVLAIRKKWSLGNAFICGSVLLCLLFGLGPAAAIQSIFNAATQARAASLMVVVAQILIFSHLLEQSGQMKRMLSAFEGIIANPRINLIIFPALIGLLPMPGGAVFSAPMVKTLGRRAGITGDQLSFINYWFRHIWEYWWPLYPGILLAAGLSGVGLDRLMAVMCLFSLLALALGFAQISRYRLPETGSRKGPIPRTPAAPFIKELLPILFVIVFGLGTGSLLTKFSAGLPVSKEIGLILALFIAIYWVWRANRMPVGILRPIVINTRLVQMVYMMAAIFVFKGILEDSGAIDAIAAELLYLKIPIVAIAVLLPFLVGIITGITVAVVGAAFPILMPLTDAAATGHWVLPYVMVALSCGFVGVLLSPLHLCLLLSNQYFNTGMKAVYPHLWWPCGIIVAAAVVYFILLMGAATL
ncbi:MAG: DUF401 family protein [Thermodesulfobacteriota bacterium]